jgi:3-oxoacyl-[acyl-carrier-protein] synthase-3
MSVKTRAGILGMGLYLPDRILTNQDLEAMVETNDEWIVERTGIRERRIAADNQSTVDLSLIAANKALAAAGIKAEDLDLIILATATPDRTVPASATMIQHRLGANKAGAFDLGAACSGFLYGLSVASQFIETGKYRYILLIGAETLSRILNLRHLWRWSGCRDCRRG